MRSRRLSWMIQLIYRKSGRFTRRRGQCANLQMLQLGASGIAAAGVAAIGVGIADPDAVSTNHTDIANTTTTQTGICMRDCAAGFCAMRGRTVLIVLLILMATTIINAIHAQQGPKSILILRPSRRQLEAEQVPLVVKLLLQVAVH